MPWIVLRAIVNVFAIYAAARLFPGIRLSEPAAALWAGLALTLVNLLVRPALFILTLPINLLTLGLFTLVLNAWMVMLTGWLVKGFHISGFWPALFLVFVIYIFSLFITRLAW